MNETLPETDTETSCLETIVSVAISAYGLVFMLPPPARHHTVMTKIHEFNSEIQVNPKGQGFLTSKGRYVGRRDAALIAKSSGQVDQLIAPPELFSEDLW